MKPYCSIPIIECGEPIVPIAIEGVKLTTPPPYQKLGADYQGRSPYYLRQGVVKALAQAQTYLQQQRPSWQLLIFDAYRPIAVQQFMVNHAFQQILARDNLHESVLTPAQREALLAEVYTIWAVPSIDPKTPPPHSTGAAIDLTLVDETGHPLDMGGDIDELSPRSQPQYYQHCQGKDKDQATQFKQFQQRRNFLNQVMEAAGFLRHPGEWWHFSKGDQLWAWQQRQKETKSHAIACYGKVEL